MQDWRDRTEAETGLFLMHFTVMVSVLVGLAIGSIYYVDMDDALDFLYFLVVFNVYVYALAFLYAPVDICELERRQNNRPSAGVSAMEEGLHSVDEVSEAAGFLSGQETYGPRTTRIIGLSFIPASALSSRQAANDAFTVTEAAHH